MWGELTGPLPKHVRSPATHSALTRWTWSSQVTPSLPRATLTSVQGFSEPLLPAACQGLGPTVRQD